MLTKSFESYRIGTVLYNWAYYIVQLSANRMKQRVQVH